MAYKRKSYRKSSYRKPAKRKTYSKRGRKAAPRAKVLEIRIVNAAPGTMVSTATLGKKSGRPVRARY